MPRTSAEAIQRFAAAARAAFERAAWRSGLIETDLALAGQAVRVRLAGPALAGWALPALAHHRVPAPVSGPRLTLDVFDSRSTGEALPPPPWPNTAYTPTSEIAGVEGDRFLAGFNVGTGTLDLLDLDEGCGLHWIADAAAHPAFDVSSPFRLLLHWWLRPLGLQLLHAGAVGVGAGAVLLAGKGGAGKSTVALACLAAGMLYVGDDYVLARRLPRPEVVNLFRSAKLSMADVERRFPVLAGAIVGLTEPPAGGKAILMLGAEHGVRIAAALPLAAIVIPRVGGGVRSVLQPAGRQEALTALLPSNVRQLTAVRRADMETIAALATELPAHVLELGEDVGDVPDLLRGLLGAAG